VALSIVLVVKLVTAGVGFVLAQDSSRFDRRCYLNEFYHLELDGRVAAEGKARFFDLWSYSDGEWYLTIARDGYPDMRSVTRLAQASAAIREQVVRESLQRYAFFPLFPWMTRLVATVLPLRPAAFTVVLFVGLAAAACFALYWRQRFPQRCREGPAALLLLLFFPFSIFLCLYFTEGLFLLLSLAVFIGLERRNWLTVSLAGALLSLTRPTGVLVAAVVLYKGLLDRGQEARQQRSATLPVVLAAGVAAAGLLPFAILNRVRTGSWTTFAAVQQIWAGTPSLTENLYNNLIGHAIHFDELAFHQFHSSKVDYLIMLGFALCLALMWRDRRFPRELTLWSTLLFVVPLATKDLMSFSRYMSVSFPVFMFLAVRFPRTSTYLLLPASAIGYFFALRAVISYQWVG
jgi:hypothetical protein